MEIVELEDITEVLVGFDDVNDDDDDEESHHDDDGGDGGPDNDQHWFLERVVVLVGREGNTKMWTFNCGK